MWRCKWVELQLKQLQSQAHKYEEELAALDNTKELDYAHLTLDDSNIKSVPISGRMHRNKVMKRKKRKRVEEQCDLASYMSNHTLFSYYGMPFHSIFLYSIFLLFLFIIFCLSLLSFSREESRS
jgi:hypothetical protein